jgi:serine protease AprX
MLALIPVLAPTRAVSAEPTAFVPEALLHLAEAQPDRIFPVIVTGQDEVTTLGVKQEVREEISSENVHGDTLVTAFTSVNGVAARLTGAEIVSLAAADAIGSITPDVVLYASDRADDDDGRREERRSERRRGPRPRGGGRRTNRPPATAGTIAIVDSGIDARRADFRGRVAAEVDLTSLSPNSRGDGRGHGTFLAGVAAGAAPGHEGVAPGARIVSIDVIDDFGRARTSDVIEAADWILRHGERHGIRVANFSLHSARPGSFFGDPLDRAVDRLWSAGIVVVTSVGNYGVESKPTAIRFAPANDPYVISVGALDTNGTPELDDDFTAPWSAFGLTLDGFAKPELGAPGRRIVGPVPADSALARLHPERLVGRDYMRLSGTSFAAAHVSGVAANLLGAHPSWSPDQVKGALMATAQRLLQAVPSSAGAGAVDARRALELSEPAPANREFPPIASPGPGSDDDDDDGKARDDASWSDASWSDASWSDVSWSDVSWSDVSWSDVSWSDVSWSDLYQPAAPGPLLD